MTYITYRTIVLIHLYNKLIIPGAVIIYDLERHPRALSWVEDTLTQARGGCDFARFPSLTAAPHYAFGGAFIDPFLFICSIYILLSPIHRKWLSQEGQGKTLQTPLGSAHVLYARQSSRLLTFLLWHDSQPGHKVAAMIG